MFTKHHPNGDGSQHLDNARLEGLIADFQNGNPSALSEIVTLTERRTVALIRFHGSAKYRSEPELISDVHYKLIRSVGRFDPSRGSGFTFLSHLVFNVLRSNVTAARKSAGRLVELDEGITEKLTADSGKEAREALEDVGDRLRREVKTTLSDVAELAAARWMIDSFLGGAFESRRHTCANAAMQVYRLTHTRSRELYDLCMLACRVVLYDSRPHRPVYPGQLCHTRARWMARFAPLLTAEEFTRLVWLARDLSPFVVYLISPESRSRRQDRNGSVTRENLLWVIHGHPAARPLFENLEESR
jgi:hypothetical protein